MANVRASLHRKIAAVADTGITVLYEPHQPWQATCYRIEWLDAEVPRGFHEATRSVRIHVQGSGTLDMEKRMERLISGLGLPSTEAGMAVLPMYDYKTDPADPDEIGTFRIERSAGGVTVAPATIADPTLRRFVVALVVVYRRG